MFIHSYCNLYTDIGDLRDCLSPMAKTAMETAAEIVQSGRADHIVVATAYRQYHESEARNQLKLATKLGLDLTRVHIFGPIKNTYDEVDRAVEEAKKIGSEALIVVAERWHVKRSEATFKFLHPNLPVTFVSFRSSSFRCTLEPSMIKSVRSSTELTWALWNWLVGFIPPSVFGYKPRQ